MKLVKLYLIGAFVAIALLSISSWWQFQQFQNTLRSISMPVMTGDSAIPDFNGQLNQIIGQLRDNPQGQSNAQAATNTVNYSTPDKQLKIAYPANWLAQESQTKTATGTTLFAATRIADATNDTIASLSVEESIATSTDAIILEYKKAAKDKSSAVKFATSEIIKGEQTIPVVETEYSITEPISNITLVFNTKNAVINTGEKIYIVSLTSQGSNKLETEINSILASITIAQQPTTELNKQPLE